MTINNIIDLLRLKHWVKNFFIFIPVFFSINTIELNLFELFNIFLLFSISASIVYVVNDIIDKKTDRKNKWKKKRPIANNSITISEAKNIIYALILILLVYIIVVKSIVITLILFSYFFLNYIYTFFLKNSFPFNILLLLSFYYLRILAGSEYFEIYLSNWILLFTLISSSILIFGKKLIDKKYNKKDKFNINYEKVIFFLVVLQLIVYSIFVYSDYSYEKYGEAFKFSIIFVVLASLRYLNIIKKLNTTSDQVQIFLKDWILLSSLIFYITYLLFIFKVI